MSRQPTSSQLQTDENVHPSHLRNSKLKMEDQDEILQSQLISQQQQQMLLQQDPFKQRQSLNKRRSALSDLNKNQNVAAIPSSNASIKPRVSLGNNNNVINVNNSSNNNSSAALNKPQRTSLPGRQTGLVRPDLDTNELQEDEGKENERPSVINENVSQMQIEEPNRRISLKRQATETSTDFMEQETKKHKTSDEYTWEDLDADDIQDPLMVSEYVNDIFEYLHRLEIETLPDANYLHWQRNLKPKMRSILVDWLVEVHLKFRLLPETLYLAINIMDRFMSKELVQVDRLQLLATGSLFIAAKYEEVYSPSVKNYAYVTDGGFKEEEILNAEKFILEILNFNMSYPNPMNFLRRISKADDYDVQSRTIGKYLLEISIIDHKFIGYLPSLCSAAAMYISRKMLGKFDWNGNLIHYSGNYKESDLKEVAEMIIEYLVSPIIHEEFFKKYASKKFMKVSILARQWAKKIVAEGKNIMDPVL